MPFFEYKGSVCNLASFKEHATFGFWKYKLMNDPHGYLKEIANKGGEAMGNLGRITGVIDLLSDEVLISLLKQASKLNEEGIKSVPRKKSPKKESTAPDYFTRAIKKNKSAENAFKDYSPSHRNEYIEWITEAKTEPTRLKKLETAIKWLSVGKSRNWKYTKK
jgi:uncharacterized protein YdeI (YjbR/CyaY-like superfamily)